MISYIYLEIAVLLFAIGAFIRIKKVTWLISGYNTMQKEEQEKYDIDKLCKYVGNFIYLLAVVWLLMAIASFVLEVEAEMITWVGMSLEGLLMIVGLIYLNTNDRVLK